jgi:hypothetical protein
MFFFLRILKDVLYTLCGKVQIFIKLWQVEYVVNTKFLGLISRLIYLCPRYEGMYGGIEV